MMRSFITLLWVGAFASSSFASNGEEEGVFFINGAPWHGSQETFETAFPGALALTLYITQTGVTMTALDEHGAERAYAASQKMLQEKHASLDGVPFCEEGYLYAPATIDPGEGLLLGNLPPNMPLAAILLTRSSALSAFEEGCLVGPLPESSNHTSMTPLTALMFDRVTLYRTPPAQVMGSPFREASQETPLPKGVRRVLLDKKA